jgi:hypothetical protein
MCFTVNGQMRLRHIRRRSWPCFLTFHSSPKTFSPVESITVCDFTRVDVLKHINRLCALADTGVIRAAQRNIHQCKNGINKTLRSPQGQPEHAFNDGTVVMARSE